MWKGLKNTREPKEKTDRNIEMQGHGMPCPLYNQYPRLALKAGFLFPRLRITWV
jgi:hypothetical protein